MRSGDWGFLDGVIYHLRRDALRWGGTEGKEGAEEGQEGGKERRRSRVEKVKVVVNLYGAER